MYPINNLLQACHITANTIYSDAVSELEQASNSTKEKAIKRQANTKLNTIRKEYNMLLSSNDLEVTASVKLLTLIESVLKDLEGGTYGRIESPIQGNL